MTITINQQPVDFALDGERTLGDLTESLHLWARAQDSAVLGILADGRVADPALALDQIDLVEVEVIANSERDDAQRSVVIEYLEQVVRAASTGRDLGDWAAEWPSVRDSLAELVGTSPEVVAAAAVLDGPWGQTTGASAQVILDEARRTRDERANPEAVAAGLLDRLEAFGAHPGEWAGLFQKGQDAQAFTAILGLFTAWETLGRVVPTVLVQRGKSVAQWAELQAELSPFFREVESALETQDYILVTDLLEYEVLPRLQTLRPFLT